MIGCCEDLLLVLEGIQKVEPSPMQQFLPQVLRAEVGVDAGRQDDAEATVCLEQVPEDLGEHLVRVEVGTALEPEWMLGVGIADSLAAGASPRPLPELIPSLPSCQGQVERVGGVPGPVAECLEPGVVLVPLVGHARHRLEQFPLLSERRLLVVGAVERVELGEELLRVRLHHVPGRIADQGVEPAPLGREHVGELQFPVEELQVAGQTLDDGDRSRRIGLWNVSGVGTCRSDSSSVGQNQTAHHSSIAA